MTARSVKMPVLNSLLFIRDANVKQVPKIDGNSAIWFTEFCVAVSCLPDCDGDTEITLRDAQKQAFERTPLFDGRLRTPSRHIIVETVLGRTILEMSVLDAVTRVQIWTNGLRDTDKVVIALGDDLAGEITSRPMG